MDVDRQPPTWDPQNQHWLLQLPYSSLSSSLKSMLASGWSLVRSDLSDRLSVTAEPDSNGTRADGRGSQTGHARTFLQPMLSDWGNLWCHHLFFARSIIKHSTEPPRLTVWLTFPASPPPTNTSDCSFLVIVFRCDFTATFPPQSSSSSTYQHFRGSWESNARSTSHAGFFHRFKFRPCDAHRVQYWSSCVGTNLTLEK